MYLTQNEIRQLSSDILLISSSTESVQRIHHIISFLDTIKKTLYSTH